MLNTKELLTKEERNNYLRYILMELREVYFINLSHLSRGISINTTLLRDFANGKRNFGEDLLDKLENALIEIYGELFPKIIPQDIELLKHQLKLF